MIQNHKTNLKKGFTLLEILLVIAAIGILAAIVIVAINPTRQLGQARNAERENEVRTLSDAVYQYFIETGSLPTAVAGLATDGSAVAEIDIDATQCSTDGSEYAAATQASIALAADLTPTYIAAIPQDPSVSDANCSGYLISRPSAERILIQAPNAELSETIQIER